MRTLPLILLGLLVPGVAWADADRDADALRALLAPKIRTVQHMALNPVVVRAVRRQNAEGLTQKVIAERDREWRDADSRLSLKWRLQQTPAGRFLREKVRGSDAFNEAFVTDGQGANVAAYPPTSDYFQGDEEKWSGAFNGGDGQVHVGAVERDASTGVEAVQISAPIIDRGRTIGVLVVGVTVDYLDRRSAVAAR